MVKFWVGFALLIAAIATVSQWHGPDIGGAPGLHFDFGRDRGERGSGVAATETRTVGEFSSIHAEGSSIIEVQVREGLARTVEISTDDNLLKVIKTEVAAGVLEISAAADIDPQGDIHVKVTTPTLAGIHLEGANRLKLDIDSPGALDLHLEGAGGVRAAGRIGRLSVHSEGAGSIDAAELIARAVDIHIEGAGRANVNASESLKARIEGAGLIRYSGNPPSVEKDIEGIGRISPTD